jgi:hypothetical protein
MSTRDTANVLAMAHGAYFVGTGIWPLIDMRSFEAVTGPKVDKWLVKTVGVLIAVVGGVVAAAGARRRVTGETALLAAGCAAGLGAIDVVYALKRRIAPIYLADALVEAALIAAWATAAQSRRMRELEVRDRLSVP